VNGADPFSDSKSDPFDSAFGGESSYENSRDPFPRPSGDPFPRPSGDPFPRPSGDPFPRPSGDPFTRPSGEPFPRPSGDPFPRPSGDPFSQSESDPFGSGKPAPARDVADPFGSSFTASFPSAVPTIDPFSSNNNFGNDPFSLTNLPTPTSDINANSTVKVERVAPTNNTVSYRKEKTSIDTSESTPSKSSLKKKTSHSLSDFLTGSPLKAGDKGDKVKEKKEKKHGKFHISSPLKAHKAKSGESPKSASKSTAGDNGVDEVQMKMAAEVSRRSEDDRRRKLQLQEEADLAYAIALSKAEAASLKSQ